MITKKQRGERTTRDGPKRQMTLTYFGFNFFGHEFFHFGLETSQHEYLEQSMRLFQFGMIHLIGGQVKGRSKGLGSGKDVGDQKVE